MKIRLVWNNQKSKIIDAYKDSENNFIIPNKIIFGGEIFQFTQDCDPDNVDIKVYKLYKKSTTQENSHE